MIRMNNMRVWLCLCGILQCGSFNIRISTEFSFPFVCACVWVCVSVLFFPYNILELHVLWLWLCMDIMRNHNVWKGPYGLFRCKSNGMKRKIKMCASNGERETETRRGKESADRRHGEKFDDNAIIRQSTNAAKMCCEENGAREYECVRYALSKTKRQQRNREREPVSEWQKERILRECASITLNTCICFNICTV